MLLKTMGIQTCISYVRLQCSGWAFWNSHCAHPTNCRNRGHSAVLLAVSASPFRPSPYCVNCIYLFKLGCRFSCSCTSLFLSHFRGRHGAAGYWVLSLVNYEIHSECLYNECNEAMTSYRMIFSKESHLKMDIFSFCWIINWDTFCSPWRALGLRSGWGRGHYLYRAGGSPRLYLTLPDSEGHLLCTWCVQQDAILNWLGSLPSGPPGSLTWSFPQFWYLSPSLRSAASSGIRGQQGYTERAPKILSLCEGARHVGLFSGGWLPSLRFTAEDGTFPWTPEVTYNIQRHSPRMAFGPIIHQKQWLPVHLSWRGPGFQGKHRREITQVARSLGRSELPLTSMWGVRVGNVYFLRQRIKFLPHHPHRWLYIFRPCRYSGVPWGHIYTHTHIYICI